MILFGLGNPEPEYEHTFHNVGWEVCRQLAYNNMTLLRPISDTLSTALIPGGITLLTSTVGMNDSGLAIQDYRLHYSGLFDDSRFVVIHDDLDLPKGKVRYKQGGGSSGGHRGIESISTVLGTTDFPRLKIGVDRPEHKGPLISYVLGEREPELIQSLASGAVDFICQNTHLFTD